MPQINWNETAWGQKYKWPDHGEEWSQGWGDSLVQWQCFLLPRIRECLPADRCLEIAPGYGRWTQYLLPLTRQCFVGVDLAQNCVDHCRQRFAGQSLASFHKNDGQSLEMVEDESLDFVFSFDSLVHAGQDALEAYLPQILRKLKRGGAAFIHHSNAGELFEQGGFPQGITRDDLHLHEEFGGRDGYVSCAYVAQRINRHGGRVVAQETIDWVPDLQIDGLTLFVKDDSPQGVHPFIENSRFRELAHLCKRSAYQYRLGRAADEGGFDRVEGRRGLIQLSRDGLDYAQRYQDARNDLAESRAEAARLKRDLESILQSRTWRLTRPLRALLARLGG